MNRLGKSLAALIIVSATLFIPAAARCQTASAAAKLSADQQRGIVTNLVNSTITNLTSHKDRNGNTKSAQQYELDRGKANLVRALFIQNQQRPQDVPAGPELMSQRIKEAASATPNKTVAVVLDDLVAWAYEEFSKDFHSTNPKADAASKPDVDQVGFFRVQIEMRENEILYQQTIRELKKQDAELTAELKHDYENSIILSDGRHVLPDSKGDFRVINLGPKDPSDGEKVGGGYEDEAHRLHDCMIAHGVTNGLRGREVCRDKIAASPSAAPIKPGSNANLITGDQVHFENSRWRGADGKPLPDELIDAGTGLPPLAPKAQYSHLEAPIAGYIQQIDKITRSFRTCSTTGFIKGQVLGSGLAVGDNGALTTISTRTIEWAKGTMRTTSLNAAAIANLVLSRRDIVEQGPGCFSVLLSCPPGSHCLFYGDSDGEIKADYSLVFWVNSKEQADAVLDALRKIAPYYPSGAGEIH